jgi:hypothetical protein
MQMRRVAGRSQWFITMPSGSTTLGYSATATRRHHCGPPVSHRYRLSDATAQPVPMTESAVAGDKTRVPTSLKTSLSTPSHCALQCRVHLPPGPPVGPCGVIVNYPTLSYKRRGWTPLPRDQKKERLRQGRLEHNTTQFSHGCRVLRSGGLNHINHRVHCVHLELTTNRLNALPTKEP